MTRSVFPATRIAGSLAIGVLQMAWQERLVIVLTHFVWQGGAIAGGLTLVTAAFRALRPEARYATSLVAFALMSASPVVTWWLVPGSGRGQSPQSRLVTGHVATVQPTLPMAQDRPVRSLREVDDTPGQSTAFPVTDPDGSPVQANPLAAFSLARGRDDFVRDERRQPRLEAVIAVRSESVVMRWLRPFEQWIVGAWAVGVGLLSLRLACGTIGTWLWQRNVESISDELNDRVLHLCQAMAMRVPQVRLGRQVSEALVVGLWRPMVLLPAAWITTLPPDMLEAVLAHELAHLRRFDLWINLGQRIVETVLFYHPAVWWLSRRLRVERELCCDTLAVTSTRNPLRYAETLEHLAHLGRHSPLPALAIAIGSQNGVLLQRIRQLFGIARPRPTCGTWFAGVLTFCCAVFVALGTFTNTRAEIDPLQANSQSVTPNPAGTAIEREPRPASDIVAADAPDSLPASSILAADPLLQLLEQAIEVTSRRQLTANTHSPWQIFQSIRAMRQDCVLHLGAEKVNAINWLSTTDPQFDNEPWLLLTRYGAKFHPYTKNYVFEGHPSQFLAALSQTNLPLDHELRVQTTVVKVKDLVNNTMQEVDTSGELSWVLCALQHYLEPDARWVNRKNENWSIERLVEIETRAPVIGAPCGGNERLFALTLARDKFLGRAGKLRGVWSLANQKIEQFTDVARTLQNSDGSFSADYYKGRKQADDVNSRLSTTGYAMEFLAVALPKERLNEPWVRNAVSMLSRELIDDLQSPLDCGPLFHSLNALILYRARMQQAVAMTDNPDRLAPLANQPSTARTIHIVDEEDLPIEGARVQLLLTNDAGIGRGERALEPRFTDRHGKVALGQLDGFDLALAVVTAEGFARSEQSLPSAGELKIAMKRGRVVTVRVVDRHGAVMKSAVPMLAGSTAAGNEFKQQPDGTLKSLGVEPTRRLLRAAAVDDRTMMFTDLIDVVDGPPGEDGVLQLTLQPSIRLEGTLDDSVPRPIAGGFVELTIVEVAGHKVGDDGWIWQDFANVAPDGTFVFESLPGGGHAQLHLLMDGYLSKNPSFEWITGYFQLHQASERMPGPTGYDSAVWPTLVPLDQPVVAITLPCEQAASSRFRVLDPAGHPLEGAEVLFPFGKRPSSIFGVPRREPPGRQIPGAEPVFFGPLRLASPTAIDKTEFFAEATRRAKWASTRFVHEFTDRDGLAQFSNLPGGSSVTFSVKAKNFAMPVHPSVIRPFGDEWRASNVELAAGKTVERTVYLEREQTLAERELLVVNHDGRPLPELTMTLTEMRVGPTDWQLWSTQRFGAIARQTTDASGRAILNCPSMIDGRVVERLRFDIDGKFDSLWIQGRSVEVPATPDGGLITLRPGTPPALSVRAEYHPFDEVFPASNAVELIEVMVKTPHLAVLRKLLAAADEPQPEPVQLLDDARRGRHGKGDLVRIVDGPSGRVIIVEAKVRPLVRQVARDTNLDWLPDAAFIFDENGRLMARIGGEKEIGANLSGLPDWIEVLNLGPEEDWFVRLTRYEKHGNFDEVIEYHRISKPLVPSLRYFSNGNAWSTGPEKNVRFGMLLFDFADKRPPLEKSAATANELHVPQELIWDGDRKHFIGVPFPAVGHGALYQMDAAWSRDFELLARTPDQLIVSGGIYPKAPWRYWILTVPDMHEAGIRLSVPRREGQPAVIAKTLSPGRHLMQLNLASNPASTAARISLFVDGKTDGVELEDVPGEVTAIHPQIVQVVNPGGTVRLLDQPLKTMSESLSLEIKLVPTTSGVDKVVKP